MNIPNNCEVVSIVFAQAADEESHLNTEIVY